MQAPRTPQAKKNVQGNTTTGTDKKTDSRTECVSAYCTGCCLAHLIPLGLSMTQEDNPFSRRVGVDVDPTGIHLEGDGYACTTKKKKTGNREKQIPYSFIRPVRWCHRFRTVSATLCSKQLLKTNLHADIVPTFSRAGNAWSGTKRGVHCFSGGS